VLRGVLLALALRWRHTSNRPVSVSDRIDIEGAFFGFSYEPVYGSNGYPVISLLLAVVVLQCLCLLTYYARKTFNTSNGMKDSFQR
jgi:uncharacterized membrane protein